MTYQTKGGGYRELLDLNHHPPARYRKQYFVGGYKTLSVEFKFDFHLPTHCGETKSCTNGDTMLTVPDIVKVGPHTMLTLPDTAMTSYNDDCA